MEWMFLSFFVNICTTFLISVILFYCVVQFTENQLIFSNLAHLQGHEGINSKIAFNVFTTTQELQFTLKNVSSCQSHLTNLETLYMRYVSFQITCLFALRLGCKQRVCPRRGLFLMYISFRFCRSVKTWVPYKLKVGGEILEHCGKITKVK